jgi:hypothetical protein
VNPPVVEGAVARVVWAVEVGWVRTSSVDVGSVLDGVMLLNIELCNPVLYIELSPLLAGSGKGTVSTVITPAMPPSP